MATEAAFYQIELETSQDDFEDACGSCKAAEICNRGALRLITHSSASLGGRYLPTTVPETTFWLGHLEERCTSEQLLNHVFEGQNAGKWDVATIQFWLRPRSADRDHSIIAKVVLMAPGKQTVGPWKHHLFALFPVTKGCVFDNNFHPLSHKSWRQMRDRQQLDFLEENRILHPTNQLLSTVALHARSHGWHNYGTYTVHHSDKEGETQSAILYGVGK